MQMSEAKKFPALCAAVAVIGAVLVAYSQTLALTWDEGFHLVAAQLINAGKRPYLDFLFAQTPLNAWWNAFWMRVFGQGWRVPHALAAIETAAAVMLIADYVFRRFPAREWRLEAALVTAFLTGLNIVVVEYGTLAQAYGICLLLTVLAFRLAIETPARRSLLLPALAGAAAGAAAASSLLTVTVAPVLLVWMVWRNEAGNRWAKAGAFILGVIVPFLPMLQLFLKSPHAVFFDVVNFHLFYRQVQWDGWQVHDLDVFTAWLDCNHAFIMGTLAIIGVFFVRRSGWAAEIRSEFYLCGWLALSTGVYLMTAHPTFPRYFMLLAPFVAVLSAAGLYGILRRTGASTKDPWPVALIILLMAVGLVRGIHSDSDDTWAQFEPIAQKVDEVTPKGAPLMADEHVYFLTKRIPPEGMNWNGGHKIDLPMDQARPLHVMPRAELVRQVKAGTFATVETCGEGEPDALGLAQIYKQKAEINDCSYSGTRSNPCAPLS